MTQENTASLERGKRLEHLRSLLELDIEKFSKEFGLAQASMSWWEKRFHGGINQHSAKKIVDAIQSRIKCSHDWLLNGTGEDPKVNTQP
jgi:transcriptional regulator with XRE-family HTH domain